MRRSSLNNITVPICVSERHLTLHTLLEFLSRLSTPFKLSIVLLDVSIVKPWRSNIYITAYIFITLILLKNIVPIFRILPIFLIWLHRRHLTRNFPCLIDNVLLSTLSFIFKQLLRKCDSHILSRVIVIRPQLSHKCIVLLLEIRLFIDSNRQNGIVRIMNRSNTYPV